MTNQGIAIAAAVAALMVTTGCGSSDEEQAGSQSSPIMCLGGNTCKTHSECATTDGASSCKGMNECAGKGWIYTQTQAECDAAVEAAKQAVPPT